jgi:hypothetical protein
MNKRAYAVEVLNRIPEGKLDYIIAFLEGASIPDTAPEQLMPQEAAGEEEKAEVPEAARALERSVDALFSGNALLEEQMMPGFEEQMMSDFDENEDLFAALEDMARAEISLLKNK